jgi:hypothetical protein
MKSAAVKYSTRTKEIQNTKVHSAKSIQSCIDKEEEEEDKLRVSTYLNVNSLTALW